MCVLCARVCVCVCLLLVAFVYRRGCQCCCLLLPRLLLMMLCCVATGVLVAVAVVVVVVADVSAMPYLQLLRTALAAGILCFRQAVALPQRQCHAELFCGTCVFNVCAAFNVIHLVDGIRWLDDMFWACLILLQFH